MASSYTAHQPDEQGVIHYSEEEQGTWQILIARQLAALEGKACDAYRAGLARLALPRDRIPQLGEINAALTPATGWSVAAVPALISFDRFFALLADRQFPVATFIRRRDELDYLQEPDIFHEIFGHCAMLTNPAFAHFTHLYGQLGQQASKEQRFFWRGSTGSPWSLVSCRRGRGCASTVAASSPPSARPPMRFQGSRCCNPLICWRCCAPLIASTSCSPPISCCRTWRVSTAWGHRRSWRRWPRPVASVCVRPVLPRPLAGRRAEPVFNPFHNMIDERSPECLNWQPNGAKRAAPMPPG